MTTYTGESSDETINLGWDSVSNIVGFVTKSKTNSYFLNLTWDGVDTPNNATVKYCIKYQGKNYITTKTNFMLPITYGNTTTDEKTGVIIAEEECIEIETKYYYSENTYSVGETKKFCFCPPVDPFCKKSKKTKTKQKNISSKIRYSNAVKNKNGALGVDGGIFNNCSSVNYWNQLSLNISLSKNNCYSKEKVLILPNQSENQQNTITYGSRLRKR